ncbi:MAG TPA: hypothetical protein VGG76_13990 [Gemmatimonadaceae bacterium]
MRRMLFVSAVVSMYGCATSGSGSLTPATNPDVRIVTPQSEQVVATGSSVVEGTATVAAPIDKVWGVLTPTYDSLGIPLTAIDPASHALGNGGMIVHRKLGKARLSEYINCGNSQGGPSADTYEVNLSVVTRLAPAPSAGTIVTTVVNAAGKPASLSGDYIPCGTTGGLETRLVRLIEAQLRQ